ncbi:MAG: hypothetical protein E7673_05225 [Ruminococcaceae bacterium]|nr:hypothetical protein [Oscillospiraceae bacterium]
MPKNVIMRTTDGKILHLECYEEIPSTHDLARKYARLGFGDGYVIFSEKQTAYDSLGKPLHEGESESGVYLSCILRPSIFASQAWLLRPMSTVALYNALEEQTEKELGIGWTSDIYCEGKRIGMTNVDGRFDSPSTYEYIIISFFVKLNENDFPPRLSDLIKKVFESENTSLSLIVAKKILAKFFELYPKRIKSPEKFMEQYRRNFILTGVNAKYIEGTKRKRCKILGINSADGKLIVENQKGDIIHITGAKNIVIPDRIKVKNKT